MHPVPGVADREHRVRAGLDRHPGWCLAYPGVSSAAKVSTVSVPPLGIASLALMARFSSTCSSWPGSARIGPGPLTQPKQDAAVLTHDPREHPFPSDHERVQLESHGAEHLAAAEGQQLGGDGGCSFGRLPYVLHVGSDGLGDIGPVEHEGRGAEDYAHLVIGLVRHSAGEPADRLHAVRLAETLLGRPALGHVHADPGEIARPALWRRARPCPDRRSSGPCRRAADAKLVVEASPACSARSTERDTNARSSGIPGR